MSGSPTQLSPQSFTDNEGKSIVYASVSMLLHCITNTHICSDHYHYSKQQNAYLYFKIEMNLQIINYSKIYTHNWIRIELRAAQQLTIIIIIKTLL